MSKFKFFSFKKEKEPIREYTVAKENENLAKKYYAIIDVLSSDYQNVYEVDLDTDELIVYKMSGRITGMFGDSFTRMSFAEAAKSYVASAVIEDEKEEMLLALSPDYIKKNLEGVNYFTKIYRINNGLFTEMKCMRMQGEGNHVILGFGVKDAEIRKEKERERRLSCALKMAKSANDAKTEFLFNMSHDIRTPMNAIMGYNTMAIRNIDNKDKVEEYLKKANRAGDDLLKILDDILEMSKIEAGRYNVEEKKGDVYLSFAHVKDVADEFAQTKNIKLSFDFENIQHRYVITDFIHVSRIFMNLLSNAIKYTDEGGFVRVKCKEIDCDREGYAKYEYTFEDNGIGMSEEFVKIAFDQFTREENPLVSKTQGVGLGLTLCKRFADMLKADLFCESKKGEGSKFTLILCCKLQEGKEYTDPDTDVIIEAGTGFENKTVLVVEDNEINREITRGILESLGFDVREAEDGIKAVKIIKTLGLAAFDLILMDIQMPYMDGYETTRQIRSMYPESRTPILALSANAFEEDRRKSIEAGMNDHIAKPIRVDKITQILKAYV